MVSTWVPHYTESNHKQEFADVSATRNSAIFHAFPLNPSSLSIIAWNTLVQIAKNHRSALTVLITMVNLTPVTIAIINLQISPSQPTNYTGPSWTTSF